MASYLRMQCKINNACINKEYLAFLNIVEDNNTNDNYNDIATITPMTTPIIIPVLSSPPPLASTENIKIYIYYMDNKCLLITTTYVRKHIHTYVYMHIAMCILFTNQF